MNEEMLRTMASELDRIQSRLEEVATDLGQIFNRLIAEAERITWKPYEGRTHACGQGYPPELMHLCGTHRFCGGCTECECHRADAPADPEAPKS